MAIMALAGTLIVGIGAIVLSSTPDGSGSAQPTSATTEVVAPDSDAVVGRVLPFTIIGAVRNFGFQNGMVAAQISVSVDGGASPDWMATGVYIAEYSIVNGATFSVVEVYIPTPWGDDSPTHSKALAKVYYGPDLSHSPWKDRKWSIFVADRAGTVADVEFDRLSNDLIDKYSDRILDPNKLSEKAAAEARKIVISKYKLPPTWRPANDLGLAGTEYGRAHVRIVGSDGTGDSMSALRKCLTSDQGGVFKGCRADRGAD